MKKLFTFCFTTMLGLSVMAQPGIQFSPHIAIDWSKTDSVQMTKSPIKSQILFIGNYHKVAALDGNGKPAGPYVSKASNDFIGFTPDSSGGDLGWITVNLETQLKSDSLGDGGGMIVFKVRRDASNDSLIIVDQNLADGRSGKYFNIDFENTVGETWNNCGGIISPTGEIWTAEEYPPAKNSSIYSIFRNDTMDVIIGKRGGLKDRVSSSYTPAFKGQVIRRYENVGYMVQVDPRTAKAMRKQYNWGRMAFEGGVLMPDKKTVYLFEDGTPGLFTKFVANTANDFTSGKLFAYKHGLKDPTNGNWVELNTGDLNEMLHVADSAFKKGASCYVRLEWGTEINGKVYIAETGHDAAGTNLSTAPARGAVIAPHHYLRAALQGTTPTSSSYKDYYGRVLMFDPATDSVRVFLEGGPATDSVDLSTANYPAKHLSNTDGLGKFSCNGKDYLILQEDLNGKTYGRNAKGYYNNQCEMYLLDVSIANPTIDSMIRIFVGPKGAELTGGMGTPDGKSILVNVQHPTASQFPYSSGYAVTYAMTGFDSISDLRSLDFPISWENYNVPQAPSDSKIKKQVLFIGGYDKVAVTNRYGQPNGMAVSKAANDFIGYTADTVTGTPDLAWITINQETQSADDSIGDGGGMSVFKVRRGAMDTLVVVSQTLADGRTGKFFNIDFENTVGETWNNCGGIIGPDGEIWTAEEYPPASYAGIRTPFNKDTCDFMIGYGNLDWLMPSGLPFDNDTIKRVHNIGYMVQVDPKQAKAIRKQYNWGRMSFEGGVIMPDNKTVYLFEDGTPGLLTKFVATTAGDFNSGNLYAYKHGLNDPTNGNWIMMDNSDLNEMIFLADSAYKKGATCYVRLEWGTEINGKVYFAETGHDAAGTNLATASLRGAVIAPHHYIRAAVKGTTPTSSTYNDYYGRILEYDPATDSVRIFLEGGPATDSVDLSLANYPAKHLSNPDGMGKITINGRNYMIIEEDLNGKTYGRNPKDNYNNQCEMYLLDMTIANPTISDLVRILVGPKGAEVTGAMGTPDGKTILVNIQHPTANIFPYQTGYGVTLALTGWDQNPTIIQEMAAEQFDVFKAWPNPVSRMITLNKVQDVAIYDMFGKLISVYPQTDKVDVSGFASGLYILMNEEGKTFKLIIQ